MNPTFAHNINNSFFLWFDNFLMRKSQAYKTYTTKFYNYEDPRLGGGKVVYGSPLKQWVYDQNITGAIIPSGFHIDGSFTPTGTSGMFVDFDNGRLIFNSGVSRNLDISGTFSVKEFNTYLTNQSEESIVIDGKYISNNRFTVEENYIKPYDQVTPAVFISMDTIDNEGYALGGLDETKIIMRSIIFADNIYQLDGCLGALSDSYNTCFSLIPTNEHPLGEYFRIKSDLYPTGYDYSDLSKKHSHNKCFIQDVTTSKIRENANRELNPNVRVGFVDFEIVNLRYPRI